MRLQILHGGLVWHRVETLMLPKERQSVRASAGAETAAFCVSAKGERIAGEPPMPASGVAGRPNKDKEPPRGEASGWSTKDVPSDSFGVAEGGAAKSPAFTPGKLV